VNGRINPSTKALSASGISADGCGSITLNGVFSTNSLSGNYSYSKGGNGSFIGSIQPKIPTLERTSLIALYNSTNGNNWSNKSGWKKPPLNSDGFSLPGTECSWYGVSCNRQKLSVVNLKLGGNQLTGSIPTQLERLTNLEKLELSFNKLLGSIPSELGSLASLRELELSFNWNTAVGYRFKQC
jgi:Leucine-rich repeat (LRR) protein